MTKPPNFAEIIADLQAAGWTHTKLADITGVTPGAISHLATGRRKDPKVSLGLPLLELHTQEMNRLAREAAA